MLASDLEKADVISRLELNGDLTCLPGLPHLLPSVSFGQVIFISNIHV